MAPLHKVRRVTIIAEAALERRLLEDLVRLGAKGFTIFDCRGAGSHEVVQGLFQNQSRVRVETIVGPEVAAKIARHLEAVSPGSAILFAVNDVEVTRPEQF